MLQEKRAEIKFLEQENKELADKLAASQKECERLQAELKPYLPMTIEEAEEAMAAMDAEPLPAEDIERHVRFASDPVYRAEHLQQRLKEYMHVNRALRTELAAARHREAEFCRQLAEFRDWLKFHVTVDEFEGMPYSEPFARALAIVLQRFDTITQGSYESASLPDDK